MTSLESLSPEAVAIAAFVFFAVLAFFRGVVRQLIGMACVLAGCIAGYWLFRNAGGFLAGAVGELTASWRLGICAICGFAVYGVLRFIANIIIRPGLLSLLGRPFGKKRGAGLLGAVLSVVPTSFAILVVASFFKLAGGFNDLERLDTIILDNPGPGERQPSPLTKLAARIRESVVGEVLDRGDPTPVDEVHGLTSLLVLSKDESAFRELLNLPGVSDILTNPRVDELLDDPEVGRALERGQHATLLNDSRLWQAASDPEVKLDLGKLDLPTLIRSTLYRSGSDEGAPVRREPTAPVPSWRLDP